MRQQYSSAYKARVVQELLREEKTVVQIAAESGVHPNQLGRWKSTAIQGLPSLFDRRDAEAWTDGSDARNAAVIAAYRERADALVIDHAVET